MFSLSAAGNVCPPAYYLLEAQGYQVRYSAKSDLWTAEKEEVRLVAHDIIQLCGLAYIYDHKGENWAVSDEQIEAYLKLDE